MCKFQMWRQNRACSLLWDVSAKVGGWVMVLVTLYALLTMTCPLGVKAQIMRSFGLWRLKGMLRMDVASSWKKTWLISFRFHSPLSWSMRESTVVFTGSKVEGCKNMEGGGSWQPTIRPNSNGLVVSYLPAVAQLHNSLSSQNASPSKRWFHA